MEMRDEEGRISWEIKGEGGSENVLSQINREPSLLGVGGVGWGGWSKNLSYSEFPETNFSF